MIPFCVQYLPGKKNGNAKLIKAYREPLNGWVPQPSALQSLVNEAI